MRYTYLTFSAKRGNLAKKTATPLSNKISDYLWFLFFLWLHLCPDLFASSSSSSLSDDDDFFKTLCQIYWLPCRVYWLRSQSQHHPQHCWYRHSWNTIYLPVKNCPFSRILTVTWYLFVYNALFTLIETNRDEDMAILGLKKEAGPTESLARKTHPTISPGPRPILSIQMQTPWLR